MAETKIAVTMTSFDNPFLTILLNGMKGEASKDNSIDLLTEDAQLDPSKQLDQVQNFIANGVNSIIVNAVDGDATTAITKAAAEAKIPLVYVNHPPAEMETGLPENTVFVGSKRAGLRYHGSRSGMQADGRQGPAEFQDIQQLNPLWDEDPIL